MHSVRLSAIALLLALGSCRRLPELASCGGAPDCLAKAHGVVIGRDATARLAAARELDSAAASYAAWFQGKTAAAGLVILDAAAAGNSSAVRGTSWTLTYDLGAKQATDGVSGPPRPGPPDARLGDASGNGVIRAVSRDNGEFDVSRPGVLAHEICHRYASRAFAQAWRRKRRLPDMLDEVAAISCETEELRDERLALFARMFAAGKVIPWDEFLTTRHPLKSDPAMIRAMKRLGNPGQGAVAFEIKPGSSHEGKVALFYAQAAAFEAFVSAGSCKGKQAIGQLLTTYDPQTGLDPWLRTYGARLCLPSSVPAFQKSFARYVKQEMGQLGGQLQQPSPEPNAARPSR